jgi:hypothetical protein
VRARISAQSQPIAGYRVSECLGAGGYGEVWKAEAPGGLLKAIKFVYGTHQDQRAAVEFKALERIKEARHPFLLSLERIEVIDGQLVIVTELAEGSLRDRFNVCRREGLPGIPRPELLHYLRDAADALDFMTQQHSLQHLDIKPENLLLLASRVKVADFGLVKNFRHVSASLMGGLTPVYASPEVFRGSPSQCSDQYSLAVVYQELLTGSLPFQANSPAELTLRHLNEAPDLSSLPETDRPVIARALAKSPAKRFANCAEMVEALVRATASGMSSAVSSAALSRPVRLQPGVPPVGSPDDDGSRGCCTVVCGEIDGASGALALQSVALNLPPLPNPAVTDLGPIAVDSEQRAAVPTLFIAIGGTGGHALRHLRRRLHQQFGELAAVPAMRMLFLDTDAESFESGAHREPQIALTPHETLELPLSRPQRYRAESTKLLRWLSRRWLYNIPRSLKTEGLRPLGRLALVHHAKEVTDRIRQTIASMTTPEAIAASSARTGLDFRSDAMRVYLLASISGGTGSGMVLDVAYAVQAILAQHALGNSQVFGILMHSTGTKGRYREVSMVNAFSWLTEYNHFHRAGGEAPPDAACGLPRCESGKPAFDHTYLVNLGDDLTDAELTRATAPIADYIYLDSLTPVGTVLDACRAAPCDVPPVVASQASLRTFAVQRFSCLELDMAEEFARQLCRDVLLEWSGQPIPQDDKHDGDNRLRLNPASPDAERVPHARTCQAADLPVNLDTLTLESSALIRNELGGDAQQFYQKLIADACARRPAATQEIVSAINELLGAAADHEAASGAHASILRRPVAELLRPAVLKFGNELRGWILRHLDDPASRLPGAQEAAQRLLDHLRLTEAQADRRTQEFREARFRLLASAKLLGSEKCTAPTKAEQLLKYFLLTLDESAARSAAVLARCLAPEARATAGQLVQFGRELEHMAGMLDKPSQTTGRACRPTPAAGIVEQLRSGVAELLSSRRHDLARQISQRMHDECVAPRGGLYQAVTGQAGSAGELLHVMHHTARRAVEEAVSCVDLLSPVLLPTGAPEQEHVATLLHAATPRLLQHGGAKRLVAVLPGGPAQQGCRDRLRVALQGTATVLVGSANEVTLCSEVAGLSPAHVAVSLIQSRRDCLELARRVHTRCDVHWSALGNFGPPLRSAGDAGAVAGNAAARGEIAGLRTNSDLSRSGKRCMIQ